MLSNIPTLFLTLLVFLHASFASPLESRTSPSSSSPLSLKAVPDAQLPTVPTSTHTALSAPATIPPNTAGFFYCTTEDCTNGCTFFAFTTFTVNSGECFAVAGYFSAVVILPGTPAGNPTSQLGFDVNAALFNNCTTALQFPTVNECFNVEFNGVITDYRGFFTSLSM